MMLVRLYQPDTTSLPVYVSATIVGGLLFYFYFLIFTPFFGPFFALSSTRKRRMVAMESKLAAIVGKLVIV